MLTLSVRGHRALLAASRENTDHVSEKHTEAESPSLCERPNALSLGNYGKNSSAHMLGLSVGWASRFVGLRHARAAA